MSAAFTALAQNQAPVDRDLKEHDQRLRKLEHLAGGALKRSSRSGRRAR